MWTTHDEDETPCFAALKEICVVERQLNSIWLIAEALHTVAFNKHFNAYIIRLVNNTEELIFVRQQQLPYVLPLHLFTITDQEQVKTVVCAKYQVPVV